MTEESTTTPTISDDVVAAFDAAQRKTIALTGEVVRALESGITERDVAKMLEEKAAAAGFTDWFHRPHVRFGAPARVPLLHGGRRKLQRGDVVEIDLGPATAEAVADFGVALAFDAPEEPEVVRLARDLCRTTCGFSSRWKCTGEVFVYAQAWARNRGLALADTSSVGHSLFAPDSPWAVAWPKGPRAAIFMRRHQVQWFNPRRMNGFYALQPRLVVRGQACSFEEMVLVDGDVKRVMGRDGLNQIGTV